jgi:hypothetical protein
VQGASLVLKMRKCLLMSEFVTYLCIGTDDSFMTDRAAFTADDDNKLRFWQSLCIEVRTYACLYLLTGS